MWKTDLDKDSNNTEVADETSHSIGSMSFSVALRTMIACGSTGWLDDVSRAAAAQLMSFSKTLSMTLVESRVSQRRLELEP